MLKQLSSAALVVGAMALAGPAGAQVVVITQDKAVAGNVTPGDMPGFPITISLPGTYVLESALQVNTGVAAITVTAGNVTIDLGGQEIDGLNKGVIGINGRRERLVVKNGVVMRFRNEGITYPAGASEANKKQWMFDHLGVHENGHEGIKCGTDCEVLASIVSYNGGGPTAPTGYPGILLDTGLVLDSTITNSSSYGIAATICAAYGHNFLFHNAQVTGGGNQTNPNVHPVTPNYESEFCSPPA